jgi:hydrogenase maturation protease
MTGSALVLGIGNVLWADDGFGVRAVEALHAAVALPAEIELLDGGTQGLNLLGSVVGHEAVLVFDAIDFGLAPGTLRVLRDREVPASAGNKVSLHQQGFRDLLALADLRGQFPRKLTLIGVQPERLADFGGSLSRRVKDQLPIAVALAIEELARWGFDAVAREHAAAIAIEPLNAGALALALYEAGRPSEQAACRIGDARFLARRWSQELR